MKICAIICEYNPFHNGHLYHLQTARALSGADAVVCVMSGNFVQRGEAAILNKYVRAKHAVMAGADAVIELPTVFATSNAELFAKGAIKLLSSIPAVETLCFGAENVNKTAFTLAARCLNDEPQEVSKQIKKLVDTGASYAKARAEAYAGFIPFDVLSSPNNILGVEYTRALLAYDSPIQILPIERKGAGYSDNVLKENYSSASAVRAALHQGKRPDGNLPDYVLNDLPKALETHLDVLEKYAVLSRTTKEIASVCDCTEGLENAFKKAAVFPAPLAQTLTSPRYTSSRIRRIALQNLLKINEALIRESLTSSLYLRVLAVKKERSDVLSALSEASFPLITRAHDENVLSGKAKECFETDTFAEKVYSLLYPNKTKNKSIFI